MKDSNETNLGLSLLEKGRRGFGRVIFSRVGLIVLLLLVQILILAGVLIRFWDATPFYFGASGLFSFCMVIYLLNSDTDPTAKITWLVLIMLMPIFGTSLYLFVKSDLGHRLERRRLNSLFEQTDNSIEQKSGVREALAAENSGAAALARYIRRAGCFPVYDGTDVTYFPSGEAKWEEMLRQLQNAKSFIFLEYFIIDEGLMWGKVLEILAQKAAEGVDVRVMYDGTCEFTKLPSSYPKKLAELGIKCKMFSRLTPFVSTYFNYRDHRKILVIDGHTAFNGGVNLSDEYINHINLHGHWKDTAVMLKGEAVKSFTLMFLQMWNMSEKETDFGRFLSAPVPASEHASGFVIPYGDCPLNNHKLGERVYMDILNRAERYVHIMTPYLILDGEMETALKYAAERGVDVKLILPGVPDKLSPYALARTHYASLLASGVQIYEYTPGFVHAKVFVCDDREAVCGTINLDYRSLYHHFECATYLCGTDCIADMEKDFRSTLEECRLVTTESLRHEKRLLLLFGMLLKSIAPLM